MGREVSDRAVTQCLAHSTYLIILTKLPSKTVALTVAVHSHGYRNPSVITEWRCVFMWLLQHPCRGEAILLYKYLVCFPGPVFIGWLLARHKLCLCHKAHLGDWCLPSAASSLFEKCQRPCSSTVPGPCAKLPTQARLPWTPGFQKVDLAPTKCSERGLCDIHTCECTHTHTSRSKDPNQCLKQLLKGIKIAQSLWWYSKSLF